MLSDFISLIVYVSLVISDNIVLEICGIIIFNATLQVGKLCRLTCYSLLAHPAFRPR